MKSQVTDDAKQGKAIGDRPAEREPFVDPRRGMDLQDDIVRDEFPDDGGEQLAGRRQHQQQAGQADHRQVRPEQPEQAPEDAGSGRCPRRVWVIEPPGERMGRTFGVL